jgi:type II secretory pathway pseudopilin PulG
MSEVSDKRYGHSEGMQAEETRLTAGAIPRWVLLAVIVLAVVSMLGVGVAWNATTQVKKAEEALANESGHDKAVGQDMQTLDGRLTQAERTNTQLQNELVAVRDKLRITQDDFLAVDLQNGKIRDDYSSKLSGVQSELATKARAEDLKSLGGDVSDVKGRLESTKNNLDATRTEFSTLIARNHDEIDELRRMGERNYVDFTLNGKGDRSKVGDVMVELRGTNVKKNQFTVALYVDDLRMEKKDRAIGEPIFFYTRGTRAPSELVVNQVGKDKVVGRVSILKPQPAR